MTLLKRKACFNNNNNNITNQLISHLFFNINFFMYNFSVPLITLHKNHGVIWISTEKV